MCGCLSKNISISAAQNAHQKTALTLNKEGIRWTVTFDKNQLSRSVGVFLCLLIVCWITEGRRPVWCQINTLCCHQTQHLIRKKGLFLWRADNVQVDLITNMMNGDIIKTRCTEFHIGLAFYGNLQAVDKGNCLGALGEVSGMCIDCQGQTICPYRSLGPFHLLSVSAVIRKCFSCMDTTLSSAILRSTDWICKSLD